MTPTEDPSRGILEAMHYRELPPPAPQRSWIAALWSFEIPSEEPPFDHAVPLTGGALLVTHRDGGPLMWVGPRGTPLVRPVRGGDGFVGLQFWPGAHRAWLGRQHAPLGPAIQPLNQSLDPIWVETLAQALRGRGCLETALSSHRPEPLDEAVFATVLRIIRDCGRRPVGSLAAQVGLSPATLLRRFHAEVELTPKALARLRRLRASAEDGLRGGAWASITADRGYADQAHLVREFQDLLGRPPEAFRAAVTRIHHTLSGP